MTNGFVLDSSKFEEVSVCPKHGWPLDEGFCQACGFDARENTQEAVLVNDVCLAVEELNDYINALEERIRKDKKEHEVYKTDFALGYTTAQHWSLWDIYYLKEKIKKVFKFAEKEGK